MLIRLNVNHTRSFCYLWQTVGDRTKILSAAKVIKKKLEVGFRNI
jgi:hypothetical protein